MRVTDIAIESPCGADWQTMKPGDKKRFCDTCKKHVHDLSAMTRDEARVVLGSRPTEGLCVRYLYDTYGDVVFRDTIPATFLSRAKRLAFAATLPMSLAACSGAMPGAEPANPPPMPMMGSISCPIPDPPPAPSGSALAPTPSASALAPAPERFAVPPSPRDAR